MQFDDLEEVAEFYVGQRVFDSPVGGGTVTGVTDAGYPQVNHVAVSWLLLYYGPKLFDPNGVYRRLQTGMEKQV